MTVIRDKLVLYGISQRHSTTMVTMTLFAIFPEATTHLEQQGKVHLFMGILLEA